ncbi:MAG: hypothetical protein ACYC9O_19080 [Candidatus Latescibacterota bacterium]
MDGLILGAALVFHSFWDGLPGDISEFIGSGFAAPAGQATIGGVGLYILRQRWKEAVTRQQQESISSIRTVSCP